MDIFQELKRFCEICEAVATERAIPICVTVVDTYGFPVLLHRMPGVGAPALILEMAERKAFTSASFQCETAALLDMIQPGQPGFTLTSSSNRLIAFGGGTSVRLGQEVYGIGISGGPSAKEDMEILAAAQDRFGNNTAEWAERMH